MELTKQSYTLDEIAEMLQVSKGAVCNMAKRHGIKHSTLRKGRSLLSVYNIDDVNKLVSLSRPKKLQYTTIELAAKAAVTPPTIRNIARKLGIRPKEKPVYPATDDSFSSMWGCHVVSFDPKTQTLEYTKFDDDGNEVTGTFDYSGFCN